MDTQRQEGLSGVIGVYMQIEQQVAKCPQSLAYVSALSPPKRISTMHISLDGRKPAFYFHMCQS